MPLCLNIEADGHFILFVDFVFMSHINIITT